MSNSKLLEVSIDNNKYNIEYKRNMWTGKEILVINGEEIQLPKKSFRAFTGIDVPVVLGNNKCRFVSIGSKIDIAHDGKYLISGNKYIGLNPISWWCWIFITLCLAIPVISLGGALPAVIAVMGVMGCTRINVGDKSTILKVTLCFLVTVMCWITFLLLLSILS